GDPITDPLTGITGALEAVRALNAGQSRRIGLSMSAIAAQALADEQARAPEALAADLRAWGMATGQPFPATPRRAMLAPLHDLGADTAQWFPGLAPC
ncbi:MAG TPA: CoA transferase, partial [Novosphingobium sp.]|nr:CoA transferase [Novosphingobium sp.]